MGEANELAKAGSLSETEEVKHATKSKLKSQNEKSTDSKLVVDEKEPGANQKNNVNISESNIESVKQKSQVMQKKEVNTVDNVALEKNLPNVTDPTIGTDGLADDGQPSEAERVQNEKSTDSQLVDGENVEKEDNTDKVVEKEDNTDKVVEKEDNTGKAAEKVNKEPGEQIGETSTTHIRATAIDPNKEVEKEGNTDKAAEKVHKEAGEKISETTASTVNTTNKTDKPEEKKNTNSSNNPDDMTNLKLGTIVQIKGLQSNSSKKYNGQLGIIGEFLHGRYLVTLCDIPNKQLRIRPKNLKNPEKPDTEFMFNCIRQVADAAKQRDADALRASNEAAVIAAKIAIPSGKKKKIISHMNNDHSESLKAYLHFFNKMPTAKSATLMDVDLKGMTVDVTLEDGAIKKGVRIEFMQELEDVKDVRKMTVQMHKLAYKELGWQSNAKENHDNHEPVTTQPIADESIADEPIAAQPGACSKPKRGFLENHKKKIAAVVLTAAALFFCTSCYVQYKGRRKWDSRLKLNKILFN